MKSLSKQLSFIAFVALLLTTTGEMLYAQQFAPKQSTSDHYSTSETVTIANKAFKGGYSSSGTIYIYRVSQNSGKEYKAYLGKRTDMDYEDHAVWTNADQSKYWYFTIADNGYPKKNYLEKL